MPEPPHLLGDLGADPLGDRLALDRAWPHIATSLRSPVRWPRKNDAASIARAPRGDERDDGLVTSVDLAPFAGAAESLVGVAVIPVSAVPVDDRARRL